MAAVGADSRRRLDMVRTSSAVESLARGLVIIITPAVAGAQRQTGGQTDGLERNSLTTIGRV